MWQAVMFWLLLLSTGVKAGWQVWGINILLITEWLHVQGKRYPVCHAKQIYNGWTNKSICRVYNTNLACLHWLPINVICVITLWKCKHTSHCRYSAPRVVVKLYTPTPSTLQMWLSWRFSSVINVHKLSDVPQKLICLLRKDCGHDRHRAARDHWQPFKSREKGSGVSQHLAGWLVTCGWHICIFKDVHRQTQYVWECLCGMWKNPTTSSEEVSSPSQRRYYVFRSFICRALASAASCKQVAWTGCTDKQSLCAARQHLPCNKTKKRHCRKLQIRSHYTATNMTGTVLRIIWAPRLIHSVSIPMSMNNASRVCIVLRSRRLFLWIGGKLQKRPVQIRRDGFIIRLKCQLLQKPIPRLHSQIGALNFQLFVPNRRNHRAVKQSL